MKVLRQSRLVGTPRRGVRRWYPPERSPRRGDRAMVRPAVIDLLPMKRDFIGCRPSYVAALLPWFLAGCTRAPSFDIAGSLFPAWIVCLVLGILLAILSRWLLLRLKVALTLPVLVYPSLAAFFTFLLWLVLFS